jgi:hypothetical protein
MEQPLKPQSPSWLHKIRSDFGSFRSFWSGWQSLDGQWDQRRGNIRSILWSCSHCATAVPVQALAFFGVSYLLVNPPVFLL